MKKHITPKHLYFTLIIPYFFVIVGVCYNYVLFNCLEKSVGTIITSMVFIFVGLGPFMLIDKFVPNIYIRDMLGNILFYAQSIAFSIYIIKKQEKWLKTIDIED